MYNSVVVREGFERPKSFRTKTWQINAWNDVKGNVIKGKDYGAQEQRETEKNGNPLQEENNSRPNRFVFQALLPPAVQASSVLSRKMVQKCSIIPQFRTLCSILRTSRREMVFLGFSSVNEFLQPNRNSSWTYQGGVDVKTHPSNVQSQS